MNKHSYDAYLTNGNITLFCGTHTDSFKNDILQSTLYANLLATRADNNQEVWWQTYTQTLSKLGYPLNSREVQQLEFHNTRLFNIVVQGTGSALSAKEQQALSSVFSELEKLPENSSAIEAIITKLKANASNETDDMADAHTDNRPVSTATLLTIVRNDKTLLTLQISFKTSDGITPDILNQPVLTTIKDGKNNIRLLRSSLDERKYSEIRESIIKKLGKKLQTDLLHLNPPPSAN
ncbi:hypothetical protein PMI35_02945 [Pseudomonas sp. GM78]|uniref:hypothetical protein n=1 Tax=Pseudomonas sp. GM78 TaxID=1144337 RepID=UPI0002708A3A|nr:hypothetical protein [Pseudomonas sp. GM78]EJN28731.1 hypothetical protein PMI35_02945 [Pseudomonas sp. GM78]